MHNRNSNVVEERRNRRPGEVDFRVTEMTEKDNEWEDSNEEALSLCDLPVTGAGYWQSKSCKEGRVVDTTDFQFESWASSSSIEMCTADQLFFEGQIIPLRASVSSDSGLFSGGNGRAEKEGEFCSNHNLSIGGGSRSDSLERYGSWGFSSSHSHGSSSSSSFSACEIGDNKKNKNKSQNRSEGGDIYRRFHMEPSPKPQICLSAARLGNQARKGRAARFSGRKISSKWGLFRPGLMKTPEIRLQDLRLRQKRNEELQENNNNGNIENSSNNEQGKKSKKKGQSWRLFGDGLACKCSATATQTVSSTFVVLRNKVGEEKKLELQSKQAIPNLRTFEWLKELSIGEGPDT